jgi:hypothetical protein
MLGPGLTGLRGTQIVGSISYTLVRFEVMDSMRKEGNWGLMADVRAIMGSIKYFWAHNYSEYKFDLSKYRTVYITTSMQETK